MKINDLVFVPQGTGGLDIASFCCGRRAVDFFFKSEAQEYQDELFGKTYYFCLPQKPSEIVAGFTVANASIFTKRLPNSRQKRIGSEVHHKKGMINYPAVLLAQLGVDEKYRGNHIGAQIIDFVTLWFTSSKNKTGCRHLIVDAYDEPELLRFYLENGLKFFFSSLSQEMEYRSWRPEKDGKLETRLMYRDMILLKRDSIRNLSGMALK